MTYKAANCAVFRPSWRASSFVFLGLGFPQNEVGRERKKEIYTSFLLGKFQAIENTAKRFSGPDGLELE